MRLLKAVAAAAGVSDTAHLARLLPGVCAALRPSSNLALMATLWDTSAAAAAIKDRGHLIKERHPKETAAPTQMTCLPWK